MRVNVQKGGPGAWEPPQKRHIKHASINK